MQILTFTSHTHTHYVNVWVLWQYICHNRIQVDHRHKKKDIETNETWTFWPSCLKFVVWGWCIRTTADPVWCRFVHMWTWACFFPSFLQLHVDVAVCFPVIYQFSVYLSSVANSTFCPSECNLIIPRRLIVSCVFLLGLPPCSDQLIPVCHGGRSIKDGFASSTHHSFFIYRRDRSILPSSSPPRSVL